MRKQQNKKSKKKLNPFWEKHFVNFFNSKYFLSLIKEGEAEALKNYKMVQENEYDNRS